MSVFTPSDNVVRHEPHQGDICIIILLGLVVGKLVRDTQERLYDTDGDISVTCETGAPVLLCKQISK